MKLCGTYRLIITRNDNNEKLNQTDSRKFNEYSTHISENNKNNQIVKILQEKFSFLYNLLEGNIANFMIINREFFDIVKILQFNYEKEENIII